MRAGNTDTAADSTRTELEAIREQFHRELMRKSMRIAELEIEIARVRLDYETSLSWRLTGPLRIRSYIRSRRTR